MKAYILPLLLLLITGCDVSKPDIFNGRILEFAVYDAFDVKGVDLALCISDVDLIIADDEYTLHIGQMNSCDTTDFAMSQVFDFGEHIGANVSASDLVLIGAFRGDNVWYKKNNGFYIGEPLPNSGYIIFRGSKL